MRIFVDMDGVLSDFNGGVCNLFRIHQRNLLDYWKQNHAGEFDIVPHIPRLIPEDRREKELGEDWETTWGKTPFWKKIEYAGERFWYGLEPYRDSWSLWEVCEKYADEGAFISTSPAKGGTSPQGKANWLEKHFKIGPKKYMLGSSKHLLANPKSILIDDADKNIEAFRNNGGHAVLVPRVWNSGHLVAHISHEWTIIELGRLIGEKREELHGEK